MLTQEILKELLRYNKTTGLFTWRRRARKYFKTDRAWKWWNTIFSGQQAGCTNTHGYLYIKILNELYKLHRVVWLYTKGEWPDEIDHINGNKSDNRLVNLRSVSGQTNAKNRKFPSNNTSGYQGICMLRSKWQVYIGNKYLGRYSDLDDAIKARIKAEKDHRYHANHGR